MARLTVGSLALVCLVALGACSGSGSPSASAPGTGPGAPATSPGGLAGTTWDLVSYRAATGGAAVAPTAPANVAFGAGGQLSGSGGCNNFTGTWTADGNQLTIAVGASTQMACDAPVMVQEAAVTALLGQVASFARDGETLTLSDTSGAVLLTYTAGASTLTGTSWRVTGVNNGNGGVESSAATEALTLAFGTDGKVSAFGGCNQLSGPYETTGRDGVRIGPLTSTMKACDEAVDRTEQQYAAALDKVARYEIRGTTLTLRDSGGATQVTGTRAR